MIQRIRTFFLFFWLMRVYDLNKIDTRELVMNVNVKKEKMK